MFDVFLGGVAFTRKKYLCRFAGIFSYSVNATVCCDLVDGVLKLLLDESCVFGGGEVANVVCKLGTVNLVIVYG